MPLTVAEADPITTGEVADPRLPRAGVQEAARKIARSERDRLPVAEHGRLQGVVSRVDVLGALTRE